MNATSTVAGPRAALDDLLDASSVFSSSLMQEEIARVTPDAGILARLSLRGKARTECGKVRIIERAYQEESTNLQELTRNNCAESAEDLSAQRNLC